MEHAGRLVRVLSAADAVDNSCFEPSCDLAPSFAVLTPNGLLTACDAHVAPLVESLPKDFVRAHSHIEDEVYGVAV